MSVPCIAVFLVCVSRGTQHGAITVELQPRWARPGSLPRGVDAQACKWWTPLRAPNDPGAAYLFFEGSTRDEPQAR